MSRNVFRKRAPEAGSSRRQFLGAFGGFGAMGLAAVGALGGCAVDEEPRTQAASVQEIPVRCPW